VKAGRIGAWNCHLHLHVHLGEPLMVRDTETEVGRCHRHTLTRLLDLAKVCVLLCWKLLKSGKAETEGEHWIRGDSAGKREDLIHRSVFYVLLMQRARGRQDRVAFLVLGRGLNASYLLKDGVWKEMRVVNGGKWLYVDEGEELWVDKQGIEEMGKEVHGCEMIRLGR
jgi:hypothetical protein